MRKYYLTVYPFLTLVSLYNAKTPFMTRFCVLYTVKDIIDKFVFPWYMKGTKENLDKVQER